MNVIQFPQKRKETIEEQRIAIEEQRERILEQREEIERIKKIMREDSEDSKRQNQ